jgi:hypothetical protein
MTRFGAWLRGRVDVSRATAWLLLGDLLAIALFVVIGEISHGYDSLAYALQALDNYAQFVIGWVVVAVPLGAYARDVQSGPLRAGGTVLVAWLGAVAVAQMVRATAWFHGSPSLTFAAVSFGFTGLVLVGWRVTLAVVTARRSSSVPA